MNKKRLIFITLLLAGLITGSYYCKYSFLLKFCSIRNNEALQLVKDHSFIYPERSISITNPVYFQHEYGQSENVREYEARREKFLSNKGTIFGYDLETWFEPYPEDGGYGRYHFFAVDKLAKNKTHILTNLNVADASPPRFQINDEIYLFEDSVIIHNRHNQKNLNPPRGHNNLIYYNFACKKGIIIELPDGFSVTAPPIISYPHIIANGLFHLLTYNIETRESHLQRMTWSATIDGVAYQNGTLYWSEYHDGSDPLHQGYGKKYLLKNSQGISCDILDPISEEGEFRKRQYTKLEPIWYDPF